jgi:hypothetical protein
VTAPWLVPPLWPGETVAILAGGPSLMPAQVDACKLARRSLGEGGGKARVIAINDAYRLAPWADLLYFCDSRWWEWHKERPEFRAFGGIKVTLSEDVAAKDGSIRWLRNSGVEGFDDKRDCLRNGRNSGYQALHLAAHLGARRIVLLGYDMRLAADGREHWFGAHPGHNPLKQATLDLMNKCFTSLVDPLLARGIEVVNATPSSALDVFPKRALAESLFDSA